MNTTVKDVASIAQLHKHKQVSMLYACGHVENRSVSAGEFQYLKQFPQDESGQYDVATMCTYCDVMTTGA